MTEVDMAYFAGFFDGEGCVGIKKPSSRRQLHTPYATVSQVRPEVLLRLKAAFGGGIHFAKGGKNGIWCWQTAGMKNTIPFLRALEPYLIVKKAEARAVMEAFVVNVYARKLGTPAAVTDIREAARLKVMGLRG